jgi:hypothetical protein
MCFLVFSWHPYNFVLFNFRAIITFLPVSIENTFQIQIKYLNHLNQKKNQPKPNKIKFLIFFLAYLLFPRTRHCNFNKNSKSKFQYQYILQIHNIQFSVAVFLFCLFLLVHDFLHYLNNKRNFM